MNILYSIIVLITALCSTTYAKSIRDANLTKDLQTILVNYKFKHGVPSWRVLQNRKLSDKSVFLGSAYSVFEESSPETKDYREIAENIKDEFKRLYGLKSTSSGAGGSSPSGPGTAHFTWYDVKGNPNSSKATISFTVHVIPLRNNQVGIYLSIADIK